jgi:hypothetical protein
LLRVTSAHPLDADRAPGKLGKIVSDRGGDLQPAFLRQYHCRDRGDRFGHRGDVEDRVEGHRRPCVPIAKTNCLGKSDAAAAGDQHHRTGNEPALDILPQGGANPLQPLGRQANLLRTFCHRQTQPAHPLPPLLRASDILMPPVAGYVCPVLLAVLTMAAVR